MAVTERDRRRAADAALPALDATRRAFDSVAASYDRSNAANATLCAMRRRTLEAVTSRVPAGASILDLGCGPGTDAEALARAGYLVTGIDWSPSMVGEARARVRTHGLQHRVDVRHLGIHELDRLDSGPFDAACSNFGPLNCVPDLPAAARAIAARLRPGAPLIASVIGRVCPWEIALYAGRRDWARLGARFARAPIGVPLNGETVWTTYYSPAGFERPFVAAGFRRVALRALGVLVPPPYMDAFAARHRMLVGLLQRIEDRVAGLPGIRSCGDHFLIVLRKGRG